MIKLNCCYCGKNIERRQRPVTKYWYCNSSCQMNNEYKLGIRDKKEIIKKGREVSHKKLKENNWLNSKEVRNKLKEIMKTDEYKMKSSLSKYGDKNPMYNKKGEQSGHWKGGSNRTRHGSADRGELWKFIKQNIKQRDNYKCRICGCQEEQNKYLQVHHIIPYKCTKDNSDDNLITLCPKCHAKYEYKFYKIKNIKKIDSQVEVYNLSVKDDETYIANRAIVHNCRTVLRFTESEE